MTTTAIPIQYPSPADRLVARIGQALVTWADDRAARRHERLLVARDNELARIERERVAAFNRWLR